MARIDATSEALTVSGPRSRRFDLVVFLVRMWRLNAWPRLMLPLPRTRKRLAAPLFVFILGMYMLLYDMSSGDFRWKCLLTRCHLFRTRLFAQPDQSCWKPLPPDLIQAAAVSLRSSFAFGLAVAGAFLTGAITITIWRPSIFGICSTTPSSIRSAFTRSN